MEQDLTRKSGILKLLEAKGQSMLPHVGTGPKASDKSPFIQELMPTIGKWLLKVALIYNKRNNPFIHKRKIFHSYMSDKRLMSRIYKEMR